MSQPAVIDPTEELATEVRIGAASVAVQRIPRHLRIDEDAGLVVPQASSCQMLHRNAAAGLFETRAEFMPNGDLLLMFPDALPGSVHGHFAFAPRIQANRMLALRSTDRGRTWGKAFVPFEQPFSQHAFVPFIAKSSQVVHYFGTQPEFSRAQCMTQGGENSPLGFRTSADSGRSWSELSYIAPVDAPDYQGMAVNRMCETSRGTWLLPSSRHQFSPTEANKLIGCHVHLLRSTDQGRSWQLLPGPIGHGWTDPVHHNFSEATVIALPDGEVYLQARTNTGVLWDMRSHDDGLTWSEPRPTTLIHPFSPSMLFLLEDRRTLAAFHHNINRGAWFDGDNLDCRSQLWVSCSQDGGRSWDEPRFVLANALAPCEGDRWRDEQCSYIDLVAGFGEVHLFVPHRWRRATYLRMTSNQLRQLPTAKELGIAP